MCMLCICVRVMFLICMCLMCMHICVSRMQIELLAGVPPHLQRKQAVYAIRGPNAATELAMLATLQALSPAALPSLPALLSRKDSSPMTLGEHAHHASHSVIAAYCLQWCRFLSEPQRHCMCLCISASSYDSDALTIHDCHKTACSASCHMLSSSIVSTMLMW